MFIWVEGTDDERFFKEIIEPKLRGKYNFVETRSYSTLKKEKIDSFLKSIKSMRADYLYATDINNSPCITAKKQEVCNKIKEY
jgi:hypothetical protein